MPKTSAEPKMSDGSSFIYVIAASEGSVRSLKIDASGNPQFMDADCRSHSQARGRPFDVYDVNGMIIENIEIEEFEFCVAENGEVSSGRSASVSCGSDRCLMEDVERLHNKPAVKNVGINSAMPRAAETGSSSGSATSCAQSETRRKRDGSNSYNAVVVCERLDADEIRRLSFGSSNAKEAASPQRNDSGCASDCETAVVEQYGCWPAEPLRLNDENDIDCGTNAAVVAELRARGERLTKTKVLRNVGDATDDAKTSPDSNGDRVSSSRRDVHRVRCRSESCQRTVDCDSSHFSLAADGSRRRRSEHSFNESDDGNANDAAAAARVGSEYFRGCETTSDATADNNVDNGIRLGDETGKEAASLCERIGELEKCKRALFSQLELVELRRWFSTVSAAREPLKDVGKATRVELRTMKLLALDSELKERAESLIEEEAALEQREKLLKDREEKLELLRLKLNDEENELRNSEILRQRTEIMINSEITRLNVLVDVIKHEKNFREDERKRLLSRVADDSFKPPVKITSTPDNVNLRSRSRSSSVRKEKSSAAAARSCSSDRQTRSQKERKLPVSSGNKCAGKNGVKRQLSSRKDAPSERSKNSTKKTRLSQRRQEPGKERMNVFSRVTSWFKVSLPRSGSNSRSNS